MRILFVEDDRNTYEVFAMFFKLEGHQTQCAHNGYEAVHAVQQMAAQGRAFDVIVMDIEMPQMNGIDAIRQVRQLPQGQQVPIMVFTSYMGKDYNAKALEAGADEVVYKPEFPLELLKRLTSLIENRGC